MNNLLPHDEELERDTLAIILSQPYQSDTAIGILRKDSFYTPKYNLIFESVLDLFEQKKPTDSVSVVQYLKEKGKIEQVGGSYEVLQLTNQVANGAQLEYFCRLIEQKAIARRVINACHQIIKQIHENPEDIFSTLADLNNRISQSDISVKGNDPSPDYRIDIALKELEKAMNGHTTGVVSGLKELDKCTGGWQKGDLIVVGARPGMGKSALALNLAHGAADAGFKSFMFQMEMTAKQVADRELSMYSGIKIQNIKTGNVFSEELEMIKKAAVAIRNKKFYCDFSPAGDILQVQSQITKMKRENDISIAFIDYLNLIKTKENKGENTSYAIGRITSSLKRMAKELDIPIVLFAQLNRAVEGRGSDRRPQLSDLRDSGSIEQDADQIIFLVRPDYYQEDPRDENGNSLIGMLDLIIAKNRQGATGDVWVKHNLSCNIIKNNVPESREYEMKEF